VSPTLPIVTAGGDDANGSDGSLVGVIIGVVAAVLAGAVGFFIVKRYRGRQTSIVLPPQSASIPMIVNPMHGGAPSRSPLPSPVEYAEPVVLNPDYRSPTTSTNLDAENYVTSSTTRSSTLVPTTEPIAHNSDYRSPTASTNLDVEYAEPVVLDSDYHASTASTKLDAENYVTSSATRSSTLVPTTEPIARNPSFCSPTASTNLNVEYAEPVVLNPDYRSSMASTNLDVEYSGPITPNSDYRSSASADVENSATVSSATRGNLVPPTAGGADVDYSVFLSEGSLGRPHRRT
jgi:hypothetical protein